MKKTAITLGLAGILLGNTFAQTKENVQIKEQIANISKIETQVKNNVIDSFVNIYNTPASIQRYVAQNIKYIEGAEQFYPEINKNSVSQGFIRFPSPENILKKKYGDCEEGFILTASALKKLGYETAGIIMSPKNGQPGHIFTIYQDSITKLYGTAGISVEDYISPVYNSIDSLVAGLALKSQYDNFHITGVKVTDNIFNNQNAFVDLPKQYVKEMNLTDIFGVMFKTENSQFGKLEKEIYEEGYIISLDNTIIESKNPAGIIKGPITEARRSYESEKNKGQLRLVFNNDHRYDENITFFVEKNKITDMLMYKSDKTKMGGNLKDYSFDEQKNFFEDFDSPNNLSEKESQEYIDLANYFLILMKDKETKELWEQTKKQREINKSKEDSLKINFLKD